MKWVTAIGGVLLAAGPTFADGATPPFMKSVRALHRVETQEPHPDYVFVLSRSGTQWDETTRRWDNFQEAEFVELAPDRPLVVRLASLPIFEGEESRPVRHGERIREEADLYCVPRSLAQTHPSAKDVIRASEWGKAPGAFWTGFDWREAVPSWADDEITITYRVQRKPTGDGLEIVRTSRNPRWQWDAAAIGVAICLAAAIILFGLWVVRRTLRPRRAANPTA